MSRFEKISYTIGIVLLFVFLLWYLGKDKHCDCNTPGYLCERDSVSTLTNVVDTLTGEIKCSYIDQGVK